MCNSLGEEAVSEHGTMGSETPVAPPREQEVEQAAVGVPGISAGAETSAQAVFIVNALGIGDVLGCKAAGLSVR